VVEVLQIVVELQTVVMETVVQVLQIVVELQTVVILELLE
jgi:hypothetical protein